ncbi:MAG: hypothetical protein ACXWR1_12210 [Bdellovibrionota bacterium]
MKIIFTLMLITVSPLAMAKASKRTPASKFIQIHGTIKQSGKDFTFLHADGTEQVISAKESLMMEIGDRVGEVGVCLEIVPARDKFGDSGEDHVVGWCAK